MSTVKPFVKNTAHGRRTMLRRVGTQGEYYQEAPSPSAPHGAWWVQNLAGYLVPVPSNSRALVAALAREEGLV